MDNSISLVKETGAFYQAQFLGKVFETGMSKSFSRQAQLGSYRDSHKIFKKKVMMTVMIKRNWYGDCLDKKFGMVCECFCKLRGNRVLFLCEHGYN